MERTEIIVSTTYQSKFSIQIFFFLLMVYCIGGKRDGKRNVQYFMYCTVYTFIVHLQKSCTCTMCIVQLHIHALFMCMFLFCTCSCTYLFLLFVGVHVCAQAANYTIKDKIR